MPTKLEDTPAREVRRKYENSHKQARNNRRGQFNTTISKKKLAEINEFLKRTGFTKTQLLYEGYLALQEIAEGKREAHLFDDGYSD